MGEIFEIPPERLERNESYHETESTQVQDAEIIELPSDEERWQLYRELSNKYAESYKLNYDPKYREQLKSRLARLDRYFFPEAYE